MTEMVLMDTTTKDKVMQDNNTPEDTVWLRKAQDVFDVTTEKLAAQGQRSATSKDGAYDPDDVTCLYRGPNGLKCAVGHWIPDSAYRFEMEGMRVTPLICKYSNVLPSILLDVELIDLFAALQNTHDISSSHTFNSTEDFRAAFGGVADRFGLSTEKLNQLVLMTPVATETTE